MKQGYLSFFINLDCVITEHYDFELMDIEKAMRGLLSAQMLQKIVSVLLHFTIRLLNFINAELVQ